MENAKAWVGVSWVSAIDRTVIRQQTIPALSCQDTFMADDQHRGADANAVKINAILDIICVRIVGGVSSTFSQFFKKIPCANTAQGIKYNNVVLILQPLYDGSVFPWV